MPAPGPKDVLIRVGASGICGTDLSFFRSGSVPSGSILGHEFVGTVVAIGSDVSNIALGSRVTANPMASGLGLGKVAGAFADYMVIPNAVADQTVFALPDGLPNRIAALIEPFAVGLHAVNRGRAQAGDKVVVFGAGPIGLCVLIALRARGIDQVLVIDPSPMRLSAALHLGALAVHEPKTGSSSAFIAHHFGKKEVSFANRPIAQATLAFDCAGTASVLDDGLHALATGGRFVIVADPHALVLPDLRLVMLQELSVTGAVGYGDEFSEAVSMITAGTVNLAPLITHTFPLTQLADAFATQMDPQTAIKVIVSMDEG
jgi:2-desacetyl-2-hydroxyethyl bacteriochlorophyllide A dehydrogenase